MDAYRAAGLEVQVLPAPPAFTTFGRKMFGIGMIGRAKVLAREVLPYSMQLAKVVRQGGYQVMHFNSPRGIVEAGLAAKIARVPAVMHMRGSPGFGGSYWLAAQALADRIIPVAHALRRDVGLPFRGKVRVVHNGVPVPPVLDRSEMRARLAAKIGVSLDPESVVVLSLSSPVPFKGLHHLVTAAASLRRRGVSAQFVCAGSGESEAYEAWLRREIIRHGLVGSFHLCGYVADPYALIAASDLLALPSVERETFTLDDGTTIDATSSEGLPRSILEAMSLGVPAVASRMVGVVEQVEDSVTGLLVPPANPVALAEALERAIRDRAWRSDAGRRAREVVASRFSVARAAEGLGCVLAEVA